MTPQEYYKSVFKQLQKCFSGFHYVIAAGRDLLADGWDPKLLVAVESVDQLEKFTCKKGMQVHLPIIGEKSSFVLMPLDFEIFLTGENHLLYTDIQASKYWFKKTLFVCDFLQTFLRQRGIPYLLDYTPSGAHILWRNQMDSQATKEIAKFGVLEQDVIAACQYIDPADIKRKWGISLEAAKVFNGLTKLAEYISLITINHFKDNEKEGLLPVTISDSLDRCINLDNSWSEGSPFIRSIRSPFSLHKKNHDKYGMFDRPPLVDVVGAYFDGKTAIEEKNSDAIVDCMWNLQKASEHAQKFDGTIPNSNDSLLILIREYQKSSLFEFHREFDSTVDLPRYQAIKQAWQDPKSTEFVRSILKTPNPLALQPKNLMGFVYDLLIYANWKPKHIANVLRDLYINPLHNWTIDFYKYPAEQKANYWARTFAALALWKNGNLKF
jgi:hypothetical protein